MLLLKKRTRKHLTEMQVHARLKSARNLQIHDKVTMTQLFHHVDVAVDYAQRQSAHFYFTLQLHNKTFANILSYVRPTTTFPESYNLSSLKSNINKLDLVSLSN